jgi:hypothetical protein
MPMQLTTTSGRTSAKARVTLSNSSAETRPWERAGSNSPRRAYAPAGWRKVTCVSKRPRKFCQSLCPSIPEPPRISTLVVLSIE